MSPNEPNSFAAVGIPLVVIGCSAGGPAALSTLLHDLPKDFPAAIVIVQHFDARYLGDLAKWLQETSKLPVTVVREGDAPRRSGVLLAGDGGHLVLKSPQCLGYTPNLAACAYCPSVDAFFDSVCRHCQGPTVGVLLTGMGSDGAAGLKSLRDKGCFTIAQDQASSAIYGMPKAAVLMCAAADVLPLDQIGPRLIQYFKH